MFGGWSGGKRGAKVIETSSVDGVLTCVMVGGEDWVETDQRKNGLC